MTTESGVLYAHACFETKKGQPGINIFSFAPGNAVLAED